MIATHKNSTFLSCNKTKINKYVVSRYATLTYLGLYLVINKDGSHSFRSSCMTNGSLDLFSFFAEVNNLQIINHTEL